MLYNRNAAVAYAKKWAYRRNPEFYDFSKLGGNCTNFASQCIYAGCGVMNYTPIYGWYYISLSDRSPSWTGVNQLYNFLVNNKGSGPTAEAASLSQIRNGDIIQLEFDGDDVFDHSPVVVDAGLNTAGTILVAANSNDSDCRPLNTYKYVRIRPVHITGYNE